MDDNERFLTVNEIAEMFRVNPMTVRNWISRGELAGVRVGPRRVRVRQSDLDAFIERSTPRKQARQAFGVLVGPFESADDAERWRLEHAPGEQPETVRGRVVPFIASGESE